MSIYVAKTIRRFAKGQRTYFVLRANIWDKREKRQRTLYLGYLGVKPVLSLDRAKKIATKLGIGLEDLRRVRGLRIKLG